MTVNSLRWLLAHMAPRLRRGVPGTQRHGTFARQERTEPIRSQQLEDQRTILCIP